MTGSEYIPDSANPRAISVPIPDVAPVTMATGAMLWTEKISLFSFFLMVMSWCSGCAKFITVCLSNDYMHKDKDT